MDIGKMNNDYTFYDGYEGEPEIVLGVIDGNVPVLHIWEGYFDDLFSNPPLEGKGWKGFTRDIHQFEGVFSEEQHEVVIDPEEYVSDIQMYSKSCFEYNETKDLLNAIIALLMQAQQLEKKVLIVRND
jgi:hypothetical protein